jgi:hypothetical protein
MNIKETLVIRKEARWGRNAYLKLVDNKVIFDDSDSEYGPIEFDLTHLEEAIANHKKKCTPSTLDKNI